MTDERTMVELVNARRKVFDGFFREYPDNAFDAISLEACRFISVEDDPRGEVWVKGHAHLAAACRYLGDQMQDGYKPEFVLDLDTGEKVELDLKAVVVPKSMGAIVIPMSRTEAARFIAEGEMPDAVTRRIDKELNGQ